MSGPGAVDVQVVRGSPTPEELAAALVALGALAAGRTAGEPGEPGPRRARRPDLLRSPLGQRGPQAWRKSGWR